MKVHADLFMGLLRAAVYDQKETAVILLKNGLMQSLTHIR